eukprot:134645-Prymnesium_polylepis.1
MNRFPLPRGDGSRCNEVPKPYLGASPSSVPPTRVLTCGYWPGPGSPDSAVWNRFELPNKKAGASPIGPWEPGVSRRGEYTGPGEESSDLGTALRAPMLYAGASPR